MAVDPSPKRKSLALDQVPCEQIKKIRFSETAVTSLPNTIPQVATSALSPPFLTTTIQGVSKPKPLGMTSENLIARTPDTRTTSDHHPAISRSDDPHPYAAVSAHSGSDAARARRKTSALCILLFIRLSCPKPFKTPLGHRRLLLAHNGWASLDSS
jgi:hypothetical protein